MALTLVVVDRVAARVDMRLCAGNPVAFMYSYSRPPRQQARCF